MSILVIVMLIGMITCSAAFGYLQGASHTMAKDDSEFKSAMKDLETLSARIDALKAENDSSINYLERLNKIADLIVKAEEEELTIEEYKSYIKVIANLTSI